MTTTILGISCFFHDSAACLLKDDRIVAAAAEERLNRVKHYSGFPDLAIDYVLRAGEINPDQIDCVAFYDKPFIKFDRLLTSIISTWPKSRRLFTRAVPEWVSHKLRMEDKIGGVLGRVPPVYYLDHHLSHAASAFYLSGFEEAAILTLDGVGEWTTGTLGYGRLKEISLPLEMRFPHSIGLLYSAITTYLGFEANDAEWKVMGLAPYGRPRFVDKFHQLLQLYDDGSFHVDMDYFTYHYSDHAMYNNRFIELMGHPARRPETEISEFHKDIAASLQVVVEDAIAKLLSTLHDKFPFENVCLAGGVILNSVANGRILPKSPFKAWYIPSAPGDDGGAVGAACAVYHRLFHGPRLPQIDTTYWGPEFGGREVSGYLKSRGISFEELGEEELLSYVANILSKDKVVGLFQGRMEFGPRALGNRSILANPANKEMKDRINAKIKYREFFRPFAPVATAEMVSEYFDIDRSSPFMSCVFPVKKKYRNELAAITHVDGSARLQTVTMEQNGFLYRLLTKFASITGFPVLLNTSFNRRGEPIVCTVHDAVECFQDTGVDLLVINSCYVISKNGE